MFLDFFDDFLDESLVDGIFDVGITAVVNPVSNIYHRSLGFFRFLRKNFLPSPDRVRIQEVEEVRDALFPVVGDGRPAHLPEGRCLHREAVGGQSLNDVGVVLLGHLLHLGRGDFLHRGDEFLPFLFEGFQVLDEVVDRVFHTLFSFLGTNI